MLVERARSIHPRLFHGASRSLWLARVSELKRRAPSLGDDEFMVEVMRLMALLSRRGGRDGHTGLFPFEQNRDIHAFPLRLYVFPEGTYVVDATEEYGDLIGAELISIEGVRTESVRRMLSALAPRDNTQTVLARLPWLMVVGEVLHGAEITEVPTRGLFRFKMGTTTVSRLLDAMPSDGYERWAGVWHPMVTASLPRDRRVLYLRKVDEDMWMDYLEDDDAIYVQHNTAMVETQALARRLEVLAARHPDAKVILDVRHNPGGNVATTESLLAVLTAPQMIRREVFVLVSRNTFSAAGFMVARLERDSSAIFVGEPPGSSPNTYSDAAPVYLRNSNLVVEVAGLYWKNSTRNDPRLFHRPDVAVSLRAEDYFARRDPVLEAVLDE